MRPTESIADRKISYVELKKALFSERYKIVRNLPDV